MKMITYLAAVFVLVLLGLILGLALTPLVVFRFWFKTIAALQGVADDLWRLW